MRKIKIDSSNIINEILKADVPGELIADILSGFYTEKKLLTNYEKFFNFKQFDNEIYMQSIFYLAKRILNKSENWKEIITILIRDINNYVESLSYHTKTIEELKIEFDNELCNSLHGHGTSAEEILFYLYSKNIFKGPKVEFCKDYYKKRNEKWKQNFEEVNKNVEQKIDVTALGFNEKIKLNDYINENIKNFDESIFEKIEKEMKIKYDKDKKVYIDVPRGALLYIYQGVDERENEEKMINYLYSQTIKNALYLDEEKEKIISYFNRDQRQKELLKQTEKDLKESKKQIEFLNTMLEKEQNEKNRDLLKELNSSEKENYYLKTQIEKLQMEIEELKDDKESIEIQENIEIQEEKIIKFEKLPKPSFANIIIAGGRWSESEKESAITFFDTSEIKFISAEEIIKNRFKIRNADYLIFDTSYNAHKNYNLCKSETENFIHIKKSSIDELKKIFEE